MSEPDASEPYVSKVDRRTTLAWLGGAAAVGLVGGAFALKSLHGQPHAAPAASKAGYGTDPNLLHPTAPWSRIMTKAQLQTAAVLCDFILPASADAPSATSVGVPDFIDEWVSAPYPVQTADRAIVLPGLTWLEDEARKRHGADLSHIAAADRESLLGSLTTAPKDATLAGPYAFFKKFRGLTIGAYYTTTPGFKDIGYIGNVPMTSYPGPSDAVKAVLEKRLKKLGL
jgi:hypothetical protein